MRWRQEREGFYVAEDVLDTNEARERLLEVLKDGEDVSRGFRRPFLRPSRFHDRPQYPVKKYMCYGLYWNPLDYRYLEREPETGVAPPPVPAWLEVLARQAVDECFPDEAAGWRADTVLVNYYTDASKLGLHVDREEEDLAPVVGLSFGGTCRFLYEDADGGEKSLLLPGNSLYVFGGPARLMRHGVGTVYARSLSFESVGLLQEKERLSLTLRRVRRSLVG